MQQHLGTCFQLHLFQWLNNPPWNTLVSKLDSSPVRASAMHSLSSFWQRNSATTFYPTLDTYIEQGDCVLCSFVSCVHKYNVTTVPEEKPLFPFFLVYEHKLALVFILVIKNLYVGESWLHCSIFRLRDSWSSLQYLLALTALTMWPRKSDGLG